MRVKSSRASKTGSRWTPLRAAVIIGAGEVGAGLCYDLIIRLVLVCVSRILDDDANKIGRYVHGVLVAAESMN